MADTTPRYLATRRDEFAIRVANRWLRLVASRRCVELMDAVYRRGLNPAGGTFPEQPDYDWTDVFEEDETGVDPCEYCSHENTEHAEDGCRLCPCAVPQ